MQKRIRTITKQKGQGIVEYALLLAFIVGLAVMLNGANLGGAVKDTFDKVVAVLGGSENKQLTYAEALSKWGKAEDSAFTDDNAAERLLADQQALANIANFFIDKDKDFIKSIFWREYENKEGKTVHEVKGANDVPILLGHFSIGENGETVFLASDYLHDSDNRIFDWMQGNYGDYTAKDGQTPASLNYQNAEVHDTTSKYLFSDYVVNNSYGPKINNQGAVVTNNSGVVYNEKSGVKVYLQYDSGGKCVAARVAIDSQSHENGDASKTSPKGLGVEVKKGVSGYTEIDCNSKDGIPRSW